MTNNEAAKRIQLYIDLAKIDLLTGEAAVQDDDVMSASEAQELVEAMEMAINALTAQPEQRWIPSGEKPPEKGSYLVWMPFAPPKHRMTVAEYCGGYWNIKTPISAWMPLPEPYKEGTDD